MNVPENAQTVEVEGRDLKRAIAGAAEELGLHPAQVDYKLDLTHFRSVTGVSVARETVRIVAWKSDRDAPADNGAASAVDEAEVEAMPKKRRTRKKKEEETEEGSDGVAADVDDAGDEKPKRKRRRTTRKDDEEPEAPTDKVEADKPEQLRGAESEATEASKFAQEWFEKLLELMSVEGQVVGTGNDQRVHLAIQAERAGRIVGKRGATLGAIRHLLSLALDRRFGGLTVDVDVDGDRERDRGSKKATPDKPRRERGGRDKDRDDRERGDRRGRGGSRGGRGRERPKGKYDEDKLRALARRAAEKAVETGKTFTINLQLNSYDRRVVHLEISEIDGVDSHSEEREVDGQMLKFVQVVPDAD